MTFSEGTGKKGGEGGRIECTEGSGEGESREGGNRKKRSRDMFLLT